VSKFSDDTKIVLAGNFLMIVFLSGVAYAGLKWQDKMIQDHLDETRDEPIRIAKLETTVSTLKEDISSIKTDVKVLLNRR
jgi:hypothetical protein